MAHLIAQPGSGISIRGCLQQLQEAHAFLRRAGARAAQEVAQKNGDTAHWGSTVKRVQVELPHESRPPLIRGAADHHNFAEVVNQCATVERMIDALAWAETALPGWTVLACHPTTSSATSSPDLNNDLVLCGPNDDRARFEVSDVAGENDGNRKEEKDLVNLGWLRDGSTRTDRLQGRTFLVVSDTFGERITKNSRQVPGRPKLAYHPHPRGSTWIIEVRPR